MKQHNDPLVTRGTHFFHLVGTSQCSSHLAKGMEPVEPTVGGRTGASNLSFFGE